MQELGICRNALQSVIQLKITSNCSPPCCLKLRLEQLCNCGDNLIHLHPSQLRLRHLGKLTEPSDDPLQVGDFCKERLRALAKDFIEEFRALTPRANQILYRQLQGKQRVLEFVC